MFVHEQNLKTKIEENYNSLADVLQDFYDQEYLPMRERLLTLTFCEEIPENFEIATSIFNEYYASDMVSRYNFGMRGYGDGNQKEQLTGIIGQTVLADLLGLERPDGADGFDNGVDFVINGRKVDIKTMTRTVPVRDHYVHNFIVYPKKYTVEFYIFASYNIRTGVLSICGFVSKEEFLARAKFYNKGDLRYRDDGTSFPTKAPLYEIRQSDLNKVTSLNDLKTGIR